jgi:hypothetical protein
MIMAPGFAGPNTKWAAPKGSASSGRRCERILFKRILDCVSALNPTELRTELGTPLDANFWLRFTWMRGRLCSIMIR